MLSTRCALIAVLAALALASPARAGFLDLTTLQTGSNGSFTGDLDGIPVAGAITVPNANFTFQDPNTTFSGSTINNTSPQYSYASVFEPTAPQTDRVGYAFLFQAGTNTATFVISFGAPVVNPVFHVANLDAMSYDFAGTAGLNGLQILNGNGDGRDGLQVVGTVISDADPSTIIAVDPTLPPPTTGARSAYGSVALLGTLQVLVVTVSNPNPGGGDGGSFTLSTGAVPEPSSLALAAIGLVPLVVIARRRLAA